MRAVKWLEASGLTYGQTTNEAKDALKSAAYTYPDFDTNFEGAMLLL